MVPMRFKLDLYIVHTERTAEVLEALHCVTELLKLYVMSEIRNL